MSRVLPGWQWKMRWKELLFDAENTAAMLAVDRVSTLRKWHTAWSVRCWRLSISGIALPGQGRSLSLCFGSCSEHKGEWHQSAACTRCDGVQSQAVEVCYEVDPDQRRSCSSGYLISFFDFYIQNTTQRRKKAT